MSSPRVTETSFIVLGLIETAGRATPYDLKRFARVSVFNFWSVPHTQLYSECARLAEGGLLTVDHEQYGRRRRFYSLTAEGVRALETWREQPAREVYEVRDPGLLKLFFGADPAGVASTQLAAHTAKLAEYEATRAGHPDMPRGMRLALESGIGHEREFIRFWRGIAQSDSPP